MTFRNLGFEAPWEKFGDTENRGQSPENKGDVVPKPKNSGEWPCQKFITLSRACYELSGISFTFASMSIEITRKCSPASTFGSRS